MKNFCISSGKICILCKKRNFQQGKIGGVCPNGISYTAESADARPNEISCNGKRPFVIQTKFLVTAKRRLSSK
jgi:hypothetical protein